MSNISNNIKMTVEREVALALAELPRLVRENVLKAGMAAIGFERDSFRGEWRVCNTNGQKNYINSLIASVVKEEQENILRECIGDLVAQICRESAFLRAMKADLKERMRSYIREEACREAKSVVLKKAQDFISAECTFISDACHIADPNMSYADKLQVVYDLLVKGEIKRDEVGSALQSVVDTTEAVEDTEAVDTAEAAGISVNG